MEWSGVRFVSISQQFYSKGFNFTVAIFPERVAQPKIQSVDSVGSMKILLDNIDEY